MKKDYIYPNNTQKLEIIQPLTLLRGIENKDRIMGIAKDKKGNKYNIFTDECGLQNSCYCWARAEKI